MRGYIPVYGTPCSCRIVPDSSGCYLDSCILLWSWTCPVRVQPERECWSERECNEWVLEWELERECKSESLRGRLSLQLMHDHSQFWQKNLVWGKKLMIFHILSIYFRDSHTPGPLLTLYKAFSNMLRASSNLPNWQNLCPSVTQSKYVILAREKGW